MTRNHFSWPLIGLLVVVASISGCRSQQPGQVTPTGAVQELTPATPAAREGPATPTAGQEPATDTPAVPSPPPEESAAPSIQPDSGCPTPLLEPAEAENTPAAMQTTSGEASQPPAVESLAITATESSEIPNVATREAMLDGVNLAPPVVVTPCP